MKNLKQFIKNECANYCGDLNSTKDYCCLEKFPNNKCIYFTNIEHPRCAYFEECVLPLDADLQTVYYAAQEQGKLSKQEMINLINSTKFEVICGRCGKTFYTNNAKQKYCDLCSIMVRREKNRMRVQKHRQSML